MRIYIIAILMFSISCNAQNYYEKADSKVITVIKYIAKCETQYSTGEKVSENEKKWSLTNEDIFQILNLSSEISSQDLHYSYPKTPCNIDVNNFLYKGKKYDLQLNGGSFITMFDGKETKIFGCELPECKKYFLKEKEKMEDDSSKNSQSSESVYNLDLNSNSVKDKINIEKNDDNSFILKANVDGTPSLEKNFECDNLKIDTKTKNGQSFNIELYYSDQYQNLFRKIVIPVFYKNQDFYIEKLFISSKGISSKTGNEEWFNKEISNRSTLNNLNLNLIIDKL